MEDATTGVAVSTGEVVNQVQDIANETLPATITTPFQGVAKSFRLRGVPDSSIMMTTMAALLGARCPSHWDTVLAGKRGSRWGWWQWADCCFRSS